MTARLRKNFFSCVVARTKTIIRAKMQDDNFPISLAHISIAKCGWLSHRTIIPGIRYGAHKLLLQRSICWFAASRLLLSRASECRANAMKPSRKATVACLTAIVVGMFGMQDGCAQDNSARPRMPQFADGGGRRSLHIEGDAAALHVEVQQATIADVLAALESFNIRYRSSVGLDEVLDGSYAGSLGHVVARLLNGYNYATKQDGARLDVTIFGRRGEFAVPAPIVIPVRRRPSD
jgi:hypothetical protein